MDRKRYITMLCRATTARSVDSPRVDAVNANGLSLVKPPGRVLRMFEVSGLADRLPFVG